MIISVTFMCVLNRKLQNSPVSFGTVCPHVKKPSDHQAGMLISCSFTPFSMNFFVIFKIKIDLREVGCEDGWN
jgi:hypothetical protein